VRLPDLERVFRRRAERFKALKAGHVLAPFLRFLADIALAQQEALRTMAPGILPAVGGLPFRGGQRAAPLDRATWRRDPSWLSALDRLLDGLARAPMPEAVEADEVARSPFLAAALQVYWSRMAALLDPAALGPLERPSACPVCAGPPVASRVPADSSRSGSRYLVCGLCATEWRYRLGQCAECEATEGIAYRQIEGGPRWVEAETCDACKTYTKLFNVEAGTAVEPFADDLASLALDVLVSDAGWQRAHAHPFLLPGEPVQH
jgi:FdhE protein